MKEKLEAFKLRSKLTFNKIIYPLLGNISISKEKRIAIEILQDSITICQFDGKNQIKKIFNEKIEVEKDQTLEKNPEIYQEKISEIVLKNKLNNYEANVIIPTSSCEIKKITLPVPEEDIANDNEIIFQNFDNKAKNINFWITLGYFTDLKETDIVSYQILSKNEETLELDLIIAKANIDKINSYKNILNYCGLDANLFEPKIFSIINSILIKKQDIKQYQLGILEYSSEQSYFATVSENSFNLTNLDITRSDKILLKQLENMENPEGPFWSEVFERAMQNASSLIEEINNDENNKMKLKEIYLFSELEKIKNFSNGIKNKFSNMIIKEISLIKNKNLELEIKDNLVDYDTLKEYLFDTKNIKLSKKVDKNFPVTYLDVNKIYPVIGNSLRYVNSFNIKKKLIPQFLINLNPENYKYIDNNKIKTSNYFLNLITVFLLVIFSAIIFLNYPVYIEKSKTLQQHPSIVQEYDRKLKEIQSINGGFKKIDKNIKLANEVQGYTNQYYKLILNTPEIVPQGVKLNKLQFAETKAIFEGHAVTDYDLNIFVENIRETIGKPDVTSLNVAIVNNKNDFNDDLINSEQGAELNQEFVVNGDTFRNFVIEVSL